ncbi:YwhD family protein [Sulfoacidibacillus thermotolerans]|uniref:Uncharacterized protein n=1 Tax=Sulfoacidibacillus thermotolerans TaxID=1765684 RepID=A0A2U3DCE4_SULT2|nr:YwhD family protein [Sulfoacidibacillus thermotolerans]PWI58932.1 hypothetical protein BM613_02325 [Sulfoacidibacillus thermotolerans]
MEELRLTGTNQHRAPEGMSTLSALIIDQGELYLDNGAIHGKAKIDQGIQYEKSLQQVSNPRKVAIVWLSLYRRDGNQGFHGAAACESFIDQQSGKGYKNLIEQANQMEKAVKGRVDLTNLTEEEFGLLRAFVQEFRPDLYQHASPQFLEAFTSE